MVLIRYLYSLLKAQGIDRRYICMSNNTFQSGTNNSPFNGSVGVAEIYGRKDSFQVFPRFWVEGSTLYSSCPVNHRVISLIICSTLVSVSSAPGWKPIVARVWTLRIFLVAASFGTPFYRVFDLK